MTFRGRISATVRATIQIDYQRATKDIGPVKDVKKYKWPRGFWSGLATEYKIDCKTKQRWAQRFEDPPRGLKVSEDLHGGRSQNAARLTPPKRKKLISKLMEKGSSSRKVAQLSIIPVGDRRVRQIAREEGLYPKRPCIENRLPLVDHHKRSRMEACRRHLAEPISKNKGDYIPMRIKLAVFRNPMLKTILFG